MNFTDELIEKARAAKTAEELITMAKAENIELTSDEANEYFAKLNPKTGKISDEELDNVSGGACYLNGESLIVTALNACELYHCYICGASYKARHMTCEWLSSCANCGYCKTKGGYLICTNKANNRQ